MNAAVQYMLEQQRKLTTFVVASALLLIGLHTPCAADKYSAFSLAVAGMATALIGAHAWQAGKQPAPEDDKEPLPKP